MNPDVVARPAATVVLLRPAAASAGLEVLLTRRPATMAFAGDMYVFPGGRVDPADELEAAGSPDLTAYHHAAVREVHEEAGIRLRPEALVALSTWTTPTYMPRRFETRFFAAELPAGAEPSFHAGEVESADWLTPAAALRAFAAGEIGLWPPTSVTLRQLLHVRSLAEIRDRLAPLAADLAGPPAAPREAAVEVDGAAEPAIVRLVLSGAGGIPGQMVNTYLVGRHELVVVDPGDPSEAATDAILRVAARGGGGPGAPATIRGIALTHTDPDHVAGAEGLAEQLGVPIAGGPGAGRALAHDVVELADSEAIPFGDAGLRAIWTPGPTGDHVAFAVADGRAIITGDLVGPRASRSVFGPPDEAAWAASLERVRALRPQALLPGHGDPLTGSG